MALRLFFILVCTVVPAATTGEPRIVVDRLDRHSASFRVDMPEEMQSYAGASARTRLRKLLCRPIHLGRKLLAVEVCCPLIKSINSLPRDLRGEITVELNQDKNIDGEALVKALPVICSYRLERVVARPGDCREFVQHSLASSRLTYLTALSRFPGPTFTTTLQAAILRKIKKNGKKASSSRPYKVRARLSSMLLQPRDELLQFALSSANCGPWYLFVDGKPVFSWGDCIDDGGRPASRVVKVSPGLRRIDLFVFLDRSEPCPQLQMKRIAEGKDFAAISTIDLYSPLTSERFILREGGQTYGFRAKPEELLFHREAQRYLGMMELKDYSGSGLASYAVNGRPVSLPGGSGMMFVTDGKNPVLELAMKGTTRKLRFNLRPDWFAAEEAQTLLAVPALPLFEPVEEGLKVGYSLRARGGVPSHVVRYGRMVVREFDDTNKVVRRRELPIPGSPFERVVPMGHPGESIKRIELCASVGGVPVTNSIQVYLASPEDKLQFNGDDGQQLRYADGFAVLRRLRGTLKKGKQKRVRGVAKLLIVDDFIANHDHAYSNLPLRKFKWARGTKITHIPISAGSTLNAHPIRAKLNALTRASKDKPDLIVWAVGYEELQAGMDLRDFVEELRFVVRAARKNGLRICLVTLPINGQIPKEKLRLYALRVKELAANQGLPVVDLYSSSLRCGGVAGFWRIQAEQPTTSATPNAVGRTWICREIMKTIQRAEGK